MKKSIRYAALLAALCTTAFAFSSCNQNGNESSNQGSSGGTSSSGSPTLKWIQIGGQPNDLKTVTAEMNQYSNDKIGVKVDFTYLDWGVFGDRVKAIINSGEPFDILFNDSDHYYNAVNLNAFADLTDMLKETPALVEAIPEQVWAGAKVKDRIYAVPTYKDSSQTQYWVWDKEVVDKYQIDYKNIRTVKDLDKPLRTIQDGIKKGEITGASYAFVNIRSGINGQFINYDSRVCHLGVRFDDKEGKVVRVLEQPDIMEMFSYMHTWYQDGIINPDAPTITEMPKWVPVSSAQGYPGAEVSWETSRGKPAYVNPWAGPIYSTGSIMGSVNSISASSKYKTEALKYLQLMNTDQKLRNMFAYGLEGVHYTDNGDGTISKIPTKMEDYNPATYSQASAFIMSPQAPNKADQWTKDVEEWNESATPSVLLGFAFNRTPVENEIAACTAIEERFNYELYTGASDPAIKVPEFYAEMEKAGLQKIADELQKQINAFLGK